MKNRWDYQEGKYKSIGPYIILKKLGEGAMGIVYKVKLVETNEIYALKILNNLNKDNIERFKREIDILKKIEHKNIIKIRDYGIGGKPYYIMDYVEGITLEEYVKIKGKLSYKEAIRIIYPLTFALYEIHKKNIIHRDIKPQNIMISKDSNVYLMDFSIAKLKTKGYTLTHTGNILGTPNYMSPEQAREKTEEIGPWSDIYSLGLTLYYLLTNNIPFQGESIYDILLNLNEKKLEPINKFNPDVPFLLEKIINKAISKDYKKRYQNALEFGEDLYKVLVIKETRKKTQKIKRIKKTQNLKYKKTEIRKSKIINKETKSLLKNKINKRNNRLVFMSIGLSIITIIILSLFLFLIYKDNSKFHRQKILGIKYYKLGGFQKALEIFGKLYVIKNNNKIELDSLIWIIKCSLKLKENYIYKCKDIGNYILKKYKKILTPIHNLILSELYFKLGDFDRFCNIFNKIKIKKIFKEKNRREKYRKLKKIIRGLNIKKKRKVKISKNVLKIQDKFSNFPLKLEGDMLKIREEYLKKYKKWENIFYKRNYLSYKELKVKKENIIKKIWIGKLPQIGEAIIIGERYPVRTSHIIIKGKDYIIPYLNRKFATELKDMDIDSKNRMFLGSGAWHNYDIKAFIIKRKGLKYINNKKLGEVTGVKVIDIDNDGEEEIIVAKSYTYQEREDLLPNSPYGTDTGIYIYKLRGKNLIEKDRLTSEYNNKEKVNIFLIDKGKLEIFGNVILGREEKKDNSLYYKYFILYYDKNKYQFIKFLKNNNIIIRLGNIDNDPFSELILINKTSLKSIIYN